MLNDMSLTIILKLFAGKLGTIIQDKLVRYAKMYYYAPQKLDCIFLSFLAYWLGFNPFCESIDRYNKKSVATPGSWKKT